MLISIDPGKTYAGMAQFGESGRLLGCALMPRSMVRTLPRDVALVLVEKPWGVKHASHGADIRELCLAAGEYKGHFDNAEWRSCPSLPKPLRHRMAWNALDESERNLLPLTKEDRGHVLCAVWQALRELGRV